MPSSRAARACAAPTRDALPTIAERFRASRAALHAGARGGWSIAAAGVLAVASAGASSTIAPRRSSTRVAARSSSASTPVERLLPAALPGLALGLDLARALAVSGARRPRADRSASGRARRGPAARWSSIWVTVAGVSRAARGELAGGQLAALGELDQQFELRVAELLAPRCVSRPRRRLRLAKHAAKGRAERGQLALRCAVAPTRSARCGRCQRDAAHRRLATRRAARRPPRRWPPRGSAARAGSPRAAARRTGSAPSAAVPNDHQ